MSEIDNTPRSYSGALLGAIAVALLCAIVSLVWAWNLSSRLSAQQAELADARQRNVQLAADLRETDARLRVTADELGKSLGLTQKQLDARAQQLLSREAADEAASKRLESAQQQTAQQVSSVASDVTTVKSDVGGVKTDLGKTQNDLAGALAQLTSMKGDLGQQSGLIAKTHDQLELLEHKGDRNYYEFTLDRNRRKPVGTISIELKKADPKHNRFTILVTSDDKTVEKRDRNIDEPLQFYSGKNPALFEVVVNSISGKDHVSGYLSTPKSAPVPPVGN